MSLNFQPNVNIVHILNLYIAQPSLKFVSNKQKFPTILAKIDSLYLAKNAKKMEGKNLSSSKHATVYIMNHFNSRGIKSHGYNEITKVRG